MNLIHDLLSKIFFKAKKPMGPMVDNRRTAIKTQAEPELLKYTPTEQAIIDRFEALPRTAKRIIERKNPKSWSDLVTFMDDLPERFQR
ncbi:MAG: hypothetical protein KGI03_00880 [Patescibacteria group bacterium]|nr:hypothetical protein [Patescibacteria group bacterium]